MILAASYSCTSMERPSLVAAARTFVVAWVCAALLALSFHAVSEAATDRHHAALHAIGEPVQDEDGQCPSSEDHLAEHGHDVPCILPLCTSGYVKMSGSLTSQSTTDPVPCLLAPENPPPIAFS
jgi:hypothetical protein